MMETMIDGWIEQDMKRRMVNGELFNIYDIVENSFAKFSIGTRITCSLTTTKQSKSHVEETENVAMSKL
jgi:hypothetical protein